MSELFKGINSIWSRLFDHRAFLNGEIQFLLRELEQKRNDKEVEELFGILENITNIRDPQIDRAKQLIEGFYPQARVDLGQALQSCKAIEELEQKFKEDSTLTNARLERKQDWEEFIEGVSDRCSELDRTFEQKEEELETFYKDLENKLHLNN